MAAAPGRALVTASVDRRRQRQGRDHGKSENAHCLLRFEASILRSVGRRRKTVAISDGRGVAAAHSRHIASQDGPPGHAKARLRGQISRAIAAAR